MREAILAVLLAGMVIAGSTEAARAADRGPDKGTIVLLVAAVAEQHGLDWQAYDHLVFCESGYNPHAVSPDGLYVGLTQLSAQNRARMAVWAIGQGVIPDEYDPSQQLAYSADLIVNEDRYALAWPVCGRWFR